MAQATSPASGRRYGVRRACQVWDVPRSSFYAARRPMPDGAEPPAPARRGPEPTVSDEALLAAIRKDLDLSPWTGEGHRKVWARLRVRHGIRVSRKRVLRLMREGALLSPHRARQRREAAHDRHIVTAAPNIMWAIDATRITTVQDGKVWLFGVAEHWNAGLLGWHVAKFGNRSHAIQALGMAVRQQFGRLSAGAARGLALRHDHGSNFMADHSQKQIRFWGASPSYAFIGEPETNGVIERFPSDFGIGLAECVPGEELRKFQPGATVEVRASPDLLVTGTPTAWGTASPHPTPHSRWRGTANQQQGPVDPPRHTPPRRRHQADAQWGPEAPRRRGKRGRPAAR
jgi:hypothetical protein